MIDMRYVYFFNEMAKEPFFDLHLFSYTICISLDSVSKTVLLAEPFLASKNKYDFQIVAYVNIKCPGGAIKVKQAIPLHAWTGPEGSRRLRLPDFKTIVT